MSNICEGPIFLKIAPNNRHFGYIRTSKKNKEIVFKFPSSSRPIPPHPTPPRSTWIFYTILCKDLRIYAFIPTFLYCPVYLTNDTYVYISSTLLLHLTTTTITITITILLPNAKQRNGRIERVQKRGRTKIKWQLTLAPRKRASNNSCFLGSRVA